MSMKILYNTFKLNKETNEFYAPKCSISQVLEVGSKAKYEDAVKIVKLVIDLKNTEDKKNYAKEYDCKPEEITYKAEEISEDLTMFYVYADEKLIEKTFYELCD